MARLSKGRKKEIREAVRSVVACAVQEMDAKNFDECWDTPEEQEYVQKELTEIRQRLLYKAEGAAE